MKSDKYTSYFRKDIDRMEGYTPGEQLNIPELIKLNTNENPFPPCPGVFQTLASVDPAVLRLYPNPTSDPVRDEIAKMFGLTRDNVIACNGSDDTLSITVRCFSSADLPIACLRPSYTLYPTLAALHGAPVKYIDLTDDFGMPDDVLKQLEGTNLFLIARPNAPTGNSFPRELMEKICAEYKGMVLIDEAYADFASDNCADFVKRFPNVIVSRTFSKSRSLAGLRFGFALAHPRTIEGMMKMKDSYNVSYLTQTLAIAALRDKEYFEDCVEKIRLARKMLLTGLRDLGFSVVPSETNFLFASPPDGDGERCFRELRARNILVRYFPYPRTKRYVRISIGTSVQIVNVWAAMSQIYGAKS
jgi:histidinol-phosphate aminotransferase